MGYAVVGVRHIMHLSPISWSVEIIFSLLTPSPRGLPGDALF